MGDFRDEMRRGAAGVRRARESELEMNARERAESAAGDRRKAERERGIKAFLAVMARHGNPGAEPVKLAPAPPAQDKRDPVGDLIDGVFGFLFGKRSTGPAPSAGSGWEIAETGNGPDNMPVRLLLTVHGELLIASRDFSGEWVKDAGFTLTGVEEHTARGRLEGALLRGLGSVLERHGIDLAEVDALV